MQSVIVGITGLDVADSPMSGLGIAKCLRLSEDIRLIGLTYNPISSACYCKNVFDEIHLVNSPFRKKQEFVEDIYRLGKIGLQVLIPGIHWEIPVYSELKDKFNQNGIRILLPKKENIVNTFFDPRIISFTSGTEIKVPQFIFVQEERDLRRKLADFRFPIVIKSNIETWVALYDKEAAVLANRLFDGGAKVLCIQEYVIGEEYSVAALANENHELLGIVIVKKLVMTGQGTPWIVVSVYDKELLTFTEKLIQHLKWVGPLELRFVRWAYYGNYSLIKFLPCFPSWIYLAPKVGQNLPLKTVKLALGKTVKCDTNYVTGTMNVKNAEDIICDIHTLSRLFTSGRLIYHD